MNNTLLSIELIDQVGEYLGSDWFRLLCHMKTYKQDIGFMTNEQLKSSHIAPHILLTGWYSNKAEWNSDKTGIKNKFDRLTYALSKCYRVDIIEYIQTKKELELTTEDLLRIIEQLGGKWKDFLVYLGLEIRYIESMQRSIILRTISPNLQVMRKWYRDFVKGDQENLFKELIEGLTKIDRLDLINMLMKK